MTDGICTWNEIQNWNGLIIYFEPQPWQGRNNGPFTPAIFDAILAAIYRAGVNYLRFHGHGYDLPQNYLFLFAFLALTVHKIQLVLTCVQATNQQWRFGYVIQPKRESAK